MLKSRPMVGKATFTIVMSMMFMNMADTNTMPTAIFWFMLTTATCLFRFSTCGGAAAGAVSDHQPALLRPRPYALARRLPVAAHPGCR